MQTERQIRQKETQSSFLASAYIRKYGNGTDCGVKFSSLIASSDLNFYKTRLISSLPWSKEFPR